MEQGECSAPNFRGQRVDGGYGWVIVGACFVIFLISDGIAFSLGIFFADFLQGFGFSMAMTSSIAATLYGMDFLSGPLAAFLVNRFGCRTVAVTGGLTAFVGFLSSIFTSNLLLFVVTFGFFGGLGFGLLHFSAIVMIGLHFEKRRTMATTICFSGSGVGTILFAPVCHLLLYEYTWRGAILILSAVVLNTVVAAALFRPPDEYSLSSEAGACRAICSPTDALQGDERPFVLRNPQLSRILAEEGKMSLSAAPSPLLNGHVLRDYFSVSKLDNHRGEFIPYIDATPASSQLSLNIGTVSASCSPNIAFSRLSRRQPDVIIRTQRGSPKGEQWNRRIIPAKMYSKESSSAMSTEAIWVPRKEERLSRSHSELFTNVMRSKDVLYSGSVNHLPEFVSCQNASSINFGYENLRILRGDSTPLENSNLSVFCHASASLFSQPSFCLYLSSCFLCMIGYFVPFLYLAVQETTPFFNITEGILHIMLIGIAHVAGRLLAGTLSDQTCCDCLLLNNVSLFIIGIATIIAPFFKTYAFYIFYSLLIGLVVAIFASFRPIIVTNLLGIDNLTVGFSLVLFLQGMASFSGPMIAGCLTDISDGSFDLSFFFAGVSITLAGLVGFIIIKFTEQTCGTSTCASQQAKREIFGGESAVQEEKYFVQSRETVM